MSAASLPALKVQACEVLGRVVGVARQCEGAVALSPGSLGSKMASLNAPVTSPGSSWQGLEPTEDS